MVSVGEEEPLYIPAPELPSKVCPSKVIEPLPDAFPPSILKPSNSAALLRFTVTNTW